MALHRVAAVTPAVVHHRVAQAAQAITVAAQHHAEVVLHIAEVVQTLHAEVVTTAEVVQTLLAAVATTAEARHRVSR